MKLLKQKVYATLILLLVAGSIGAQSADSKPVIQPVAESGRFYGGLGAGLDYGGLGAKMEYLQTKNLGFFGGLGYNLAPIGRNDYFRSALQLDIILR